MSSTCENYTKHDAFGVFFKNVLPIVCEYRRWHWHTLRPIHSAMTLTAGGDHPPRGHILLAHNSRTWNTANDRYWQVPDRPKSCVPLIQIIDSSCATEARKEHVEKKKKTPYLSQKLSFAVWSARLGVCHHLRQLWFGLIGFIPDGFHRGRGLLGSTLRNRLK